MWWFNCSRPKKDQGTLTLKINMTLHNSYCRTSGVPSRNNAPFKFLPQLYSALTLKRVESICSWAKSVGQCQADGRVVPTAPWSSYTDAAAYVELSGLTIDFRKHYYPWLCCNIWPLDFIFRKFDTAQNCLFPWINSCHSNHPCSV